MNQGTGTESVLYVEEIFHYWRWKKDLEENCIGSNGTYQYQTEYPGLDQGTTRFLASQQHKIEKINPNLLNITLITAKDIQKKKLSLMLW